MEGDIDLLGILGISDEVRNGYSRSGSIHRRGGRLAGELRRWSGSPAPAPPSTTSLTNGVARRTLDVTPPDTRWPGDAPPPSRGWRRPSPGREAAPTEGSVMTSTDTVVVGAGHAGLAVSRLLTEPAATTSSLERGRVAERWHVAALGFAAPAHPELDDPPARLVLPRRRPGRLP